MDRPTGAARDLFRKYIVANLLILLLPTLVALGFYAFSARTIRNDVDELAQNQLLSSLATVDRQLLDIQKVAAQLAIDYEVNFYLNNPGPFSPVETYNLKRISEKLSSFVLGNDLLSHCFLYFAIPDIVAYDNGFSGFDSFFGPVFTAEGYDRERFRKVILTGSVDETIYTRMDTSFSGLKSESHLAVRPIGYGAYNRGALIGVMEGRNLNRLLLGLPEKYGGWVAIYNRDGSLVAATDPEAERLAYREGPKHPGSIGKARIGRESYRTYRAHSQVSGWDYVAALNEKKILADTRSARDAALFILGFGFLAGCAVSYWFAYSHSKPLGRLFSLLIGESSRQDESDTGIYEKVEKAIAGLSDSRSLLEDEVRRAKGIARADFFRRLFDGAYRDRESFAREVARLDIDLSSCGQRFVVLCRIIAPDYAENPVSPFSVTEAMLAGSDQSDAGLPEGKKLLAAGEYLVSLSFVDTAFVLLASDHDRVSVSRLADVLRSATSPGFQGTIAFGAGDPVQDPFLLQLSFAQAETALRRPAASGSGREVFYADLPVPSGGFLYPLDVEESVMRAVRSANRELFDSLFDSLSRANFEERVLSARETHDLTATLRGTALRLLPEHPAMSGALRERLYTASDSASGNDPLGTVRAVFVEMIETGEAMKKSHNRRLSAEARDFIVDNFADPGLGLALVARKLGMSENYLSNLYKEQTGECISETIESVRMEKARTLLSGTDLSVDLIAGRTGYQVPSFRRAFKRVTGLSPSDFRKRAAG